MCALGDEIISVIPEHLEDVAIESSSGWRFIQVKSRDPERGPWKLSDLTGDGGALRSLLRTYREVDRLDASLEISVEGALRRQNPIEHLTSDGDRADAKLVEGVSKALELDKNDTVEFLSRVSLSNSPPPRAFAEQANLILLHQQDPAADHETVVSRHEVLVAEIERAMRADPLGGDFPKHVTHPALRTSQTEELLAAKQLTRDRLRELIPDLEEEPKSLLIRAVDADSPPMTMLERKLIAGGATEEIIETARGLRANAQRHWMRLRAASRYPVGAKLEDLQVRLETHAKALRATHEQDVRPAVGMWSEMLSQFTTSASTIDFHSVVDHDPMLLMGEVGSLADDCLIDFGLAE